MKTVVECGKSLQNWAERGDIAIQFFLEDFKENIFFIGEICVKSAAGFACFCSNIFNTRVLKAVSCEDGAGRLDQLLSCQKGALLL